MIQTDIDFPDFLPRPLIDERAPQIGPTFDRTEMSNGRARNRRISSSPPVADRISFIFNAGQAAAFVSWYRNQARFGVSWFNAKLKTELGVDTPVVLRFTNANTPYTGPIPIAQNLYRVSADVEMYEQPRFPDEWGQYPEWIAAAGWLDIIVNRILPEYTEE